MENKLYTPEEIQKKFDTLPPDIKEAVYGPEMLTVIKNLGEKYKLHLDQLGALEAETVDVMTGFSSSENFPRNLTNTLGITEQTANEIARNINEQLFAKIRESMKKAAQPTAVAPAPATPPAVASKPLAPVSPITAPAPTPPPLAPMPSAPAVARPAVPAAATPAAPAITPPAPKPAVPLVADLALSQKTISVPKAPVAPAATPTAPAAAKPPANKPPAPPQPSGYTTDPYREPTT